MSQGRNCILLKLDIVLGLATAAYAAPIPGVAAELTEKGSQLGLEQHADKTTQWLSKYAENHVGDSVKRLQKALLISNKSKQKFEFNARKQWTIFDTL
jgi:hypothetical protein